MGSGPARGAARLTRPGLTALLCLAGAALRFSALDARDPWYDEAFVLGRAESGDWRVTAFGPPGEVEPPLFHALLRGWIGAHGGDTGLATIRALPAACSAATLLTAARLYTRLLPPGAAQAALALLAFSPVQLVYAQEARPHALRQLLELGALLALTAGRGPWIWAAALATGALAHSLALLALPAAAAWRWRAGPRTGRRTFVVALLLVPVPLALHLLASPGMRGAIGSWQAAEPGVAAAGPWWRGLAEALLGGGWAPAGAGQGLAVLVGLGVVALRREWRRPATAALLAFALLPPLLLYAAHRAGAVAHPRPRYVLPAQPLLLGLAARGAFALPHPALRAVALAAALGTGAVGSVRYLAGAEPVLDQPPFRHPLRAAADRITAASRPGDLVLCRDVTTAEPLRRVLGGRLPVAYVQGIGGETAGEARLHGDPVAPSRALRDHPRVWFVVAPLRRAEPAGPPAWAREEFHGATREEEFRLPGMLIQRWRR